MEQLLGQQLGQTRLLRPLPGLGEPAHSILLQNYKRPERVKELAELNALTIQDDDKSKLLFGPITDGFGSRTSEIALLIPKIGRRSVVLNNYGRLNWLNQTLQVVTAPNDVMSIMLNRKNETNFVTSIIAASEGELTESEVYAAINGDGIVLLSSPTEKAKDGLLYLDRNDVNGRILAEVATAVEGMVNGSGRIVRHDESAFAQHFANHPLTQASQPIGEISQIAGLLDLYFPDALGYSLHSLFIAAENYAHSEDVYLSMLIDKTFYNHLFDIFSYLGNTGAAKYLSEDYFMHVGSPCRPVLLHVGETRQAMSEVLPMLTDSMNATAQALQTDQSRRNMLRYNQLQNQATICQAVGQIN